MSSIFNQPNFDITLLKKGDAIRIAKTKPMLKNNVPVIHACDMLLRLAKMEGVLLMSTETSSELFGKVVLVLGIFTYDKWTYLQVALRYDKTKRCLILPFFVDRNYGIWRRDHKILLKEVIKPPDFYLFNQNLT